MYTGRLTADAEVRPVKGDRTVTGFTLAINKRFTTGTGEQKEKREKTAYLVCSYWRNAGIAAFLKKGTLITVTGWPGSEAWIDREGNAQSNLTLSVDHIQLYGKAGQISGAGEAAVIPAETGSRPIKSKTKAAEIAAQSADDEDLPF